MSRPTSDKMKNYAVALEAQSLAKKAYEEQKFEKAAAAYQLALDAWSKCEYSPEHSRYAAVCREHMFDARRRAEGVKAEVARRSPSPPPPSLPAFVSAPPYPHQMCSPHVLPEGWIIEYDTSTPPVPFYINTITRKSQWTAPEAPARCSVADASHARQPSPPPSSHTEIHIHNHSHPPSRPPPSHAHTHAYVPTAPPLDDFFQTAAPTPPDELTDQCFSCNLFSDPVVADDGFTYERSSIEAYWTRYPLTSPKTNARITCESMISSLDGVSIVGVTRASSAKINPKP